MRSLTSSTREAGTGRARLHPGEVVGAARDVLPADRQHMAEARCRDQRGPARPCPRGSCWWRRSCRAARGRAPARRGRLRPAPAACRSGRPATGSPGTLGVLARQIWPLAASCRAMSVKVPPISTATASEARQPKAVRHRRGGGTPRSPAAWRAAWPWPIVVDLAVDERHAVEPLRRLGGHEAAQPRPRPHARADGRRDGRSRRRRRSRCAARRRAAARCRPTAAPARARGWCRD